MSENVTFLTAGSFSGSAKVWNFTVDDQFGEYKTVSPNNLYALTRRVYVEEGENVDHTFEL